MRPPSPSDFFPLPCFYPPVSVFLITAIAETNLRAPFCRGHCGALISSFRDMALLTSLVALMPLEGLKCHLSLAEQPRTVQNIKYLSG